jgi:hypothetical protein
MKHFAYLSWLLFTFGATQRIICTIFFVFCSLSDISSVAHRSQAICFICAFAKRFVLNERKSIHLVPFSQCQIVLSISFFISWLHSELLASVSSLAFASSVFDLF